MKMYELTLAQKKAKSESKVKGLITVGVVKDIKIPLYSMAKDVRDTFKPYKTPFQFFRDLYAQLFYGIGHVLKGLSAILISPFILIYACVAAPFAKKGERADLFILPGLMFLSGAVYLFRGVTQVVAWPLTLLLRMPVRLAITLFQDAPKIEDSKGLRELVQKHDAANYAGDDPKKIANASSTQFIISEVLNAKVVKAFKRGQKTNISKDAYQIACLTNYHSPYNNRTALAPFLKDEFTRRDQEVAAATETRAARKAK
jgi:hypothetical protein